MVEQQIEMLSALLVGDEQNADLLFQRGIAYSAREQWPEALADLDRAIALAGQAVAYQQRGLVRALSGSMAAAMRDWQTTLDLDPQSTPALVNLGWQLHLAGENDLALAYLTRAIEVEPTHALAYTNRAEVYGALKQPQRQFADWFRASNLIAAGQDSSIGES